MRKGPLSVAQVSASAEGGGAEAVARGLLRGLRERGHEAHLLVGRGAPVGEHVHAFPTDPATRLAHLAAGAGRVVDRWRGLETWRYPASRRMLDVLPETPDLVHLHNLHGGYFDLGLLPEVSRDLPVVLTLHDAWLLSGHCAHSMGCERWRTGCGSCPDLNIYPAVRRDATATNWRRKRDVFGRSRLYAATPSRWLAERVRASMLAPALEDLRVIPNGVDLGTFHPGKRSEARRVVGLPEEGPVLLHVAGRVADNPFKDAETAEAAAVRAAEALGRDVTLVALGGSRRPEPGRRVGRVVIRTVPFEADLARVASWYRAANLYLHAARADTFPSAVLEALACGTPVVATAVGGIPEQVRSLTGPDAAGSGGVGLRQATGVLVAPGDPESMARALARLLSDEATRRTLGSNALRDASARFDASAQVGAYEAWYREILTSRGDRA